jgi:hypothetical protein
MTRCNGVIEMHDGQSQARSDPMRIHFDDDPEGGQNRLPYHHYCLLICIGFALGGVACWVICLEQTEPMFF